LIRQEIMEILSLWLSTILPLIFFFSYFAMNVKVLWTFLLLLAINPFILYKKRIKLLSSCKKLKINNDFFMVCYHNGNGKNMFIWCIPVCTTATCTSVHSYRYIVVVYEQIETHL
jgi:hypothetical protein